MHKLIQLGVDEPYCMSLSHGGLIHKSFALYSEYMISNVDFFLNKCLASHDGSLIMTCLMICCLINCFSSSHFCISFLEIVILWVSMVSPPNVL